ncbi:DUF4126 domain-containing protein [Empedobacter falsenii]|uniref:DUF4126 domain-containing protein n=2 Tax=Empedobacter TaxID=59734 RepID=A0ABY8V6N3_9FLAO|nr:MULTISPECIES: DUF4126 domain-containing protein [Empedobacter]MCA4776608.1 DUF4126 domain-containing protein [Empedobacter stercoris]MCA4781251.1 DUF4126 domain-containing protein [Empedobacter stercoris]MCA4809753.1 DUF4126 domain-containing protein [Empedobacter stercoris]MDM1523450.1 DUF4126 domain-containing protein [Empedobacter sp. 225-1]MDM1543392.1 DUF4126 domain-containing protein [Empedobacter sp. 189-2]
MNDLLSMTTVFSLFLGIGLAAAAGFRIFLPLFVLSLVVKFGGSFINLDDSWMWIGSTPALITLGVAMLVEIGAYYIPIIDNLLDTVAVPLAGIAGTIAVGITLPEMNEVATWALAIIAGGGTAAAISGTTAAARAVSTTTTAGAGNFLVNTGETFSSIVLSITAIVLAPLAFIFVLFILYVCYRAYKSVQKKGDQLLAEEL